MTDVVAEVKEIVDVEKEVEKSDVEEKSKNGVEVDEKSAEKNKNGAEPDEESVEKSKNGAEDDEKSVENGNVKENGVSEKEVPTESSEVCGIKRKSEVGLESDEAPVESAEKKQKLEESADKEEVEANGS